MKVNHSKLIEQLNKKALGINFHSINMININSGSLGDQAR